MLNGGKRPKSNKNRRVQRPEARRTVSGVAPARMRQQQPGNARQNYERYIALAKDAEQAGDPVLSENYYQHAEHYLRTMREAVS